MMKLSSYSFDLFGIIRAPVWAYALIVTFGDPVFWVLLMMLLRDINAMFKFKEK